MSEVSIPVDEERPGYLPVPPGTDPWPASWSFTTRAG